MIDHDKRVIFIHIARTGGTTIEKWFVNQDYWHINSNEKHLSAIAAKKLYRVYWEDYYKFSIVRNPFERFRSLFKNGERYGLYLNSNGEIELDIYKTLCNYPNICEGNLAAPDPSISMNYSSKPGMAYQNLLSEDVEVFKYENYQTILDMLASKFSLPSKIEWMEKSEGKPQLSQRSIGFIQEIHEHDFAKFGYSPLDIATF